MPARLSNRPEREDVDAPQQIRMVAFDLDGTLTRGKTCLQAIADAFGFAEQMSAWERARTEEEITAARVGVWQHLHQRSSKEITAPLAEIPLAPGAREGIAALQAAGITVVIVSLALASHVAYFARRLDVDTFIATEPDGLGGFRHVFPATKPTLLREHARTLGIRSEHIVTVGDTAGDIPMLRAFGTSIYVGATLPDDFIPTWHLPAAPIDQIARILIQPAHVNEPASQRSWEPIQ